MKSIFPLIVLYIVGCGTGYVQEIVTVAGTTIDIDSARFEFPDSAVLDSVNIVIERHSISKKTFDQGYTLSGTSYIVKPLELGFEKPIQFSLPVKQKDLVFASRIGSGFAPLANSYVENDTLKAQLWHGGEYYVIKKTSQYGIINHSDVENALLIVTDPYISDYVRKFSINLKRNGYDKPVWTFVYNIDKSVEDNSLLLRDDLNNLHEQYGSFRLDVVSFGLGGLVLHRYAADTALYQRDLSSAVIAVGTPFMGANFAIIDTIRQARSPYRYFFLDALGDFIKDIEPGAELISWIKENRSIGARYSYFDDSENKNFASIRGKRVFPGNLEEGIEGDGLISLKSTMLTALEPAPFLMDHFELYKNKDVHKVISDFVFLYRSFTWPGIFKKVWKGEEDFSSITDIWEKENKLNYRDRSFDVLLEWNQNMLNSVPANGILITNGDNDTYPAWYLQGKGVRNDVIIVNRSLFNVKDYVLFLQKKGLPLYLSESELEKITPLKKNGTIVWISDQLLAILFKQNERPVVISTTVYSPERFNVPLNLAGVVYEINTNGVKMGDKYVNVEKSKQLFFTVYSYEKFLSARPDSIGEDINMMYSNYIASLHKLAVALEDEQKYNDAIEIILYAKKFMYAEKAYHPILDLEEALVRIETGDQKTADSLFDYVLNRPQSDIVIKKGIAEKYAKLGNKEKAIKILADCLKDEPGNKEIIEMIKQYQEEL